MTKIMRKKFLTGCFAVLAGASVAVCANGIARMVSKAEESAEPTVAEFSADKLLMHGAMVRLENDDKNGIRFPVRMSVADFNTYSTLIEESGTVVRFGDKEKEVITTNNWKEIFDEDRNETYMQTLVYVWNLPETAYNQDFYFKGYVKMKGSEERIYSKELARSMTDVAKSALDSGEYASYADTLQGYIRYDVTFVDGETSTTKLVKYNSAVEMPEDPIPAKSYEEFKYWATADGKEYDFASIVTEDITLTAVYEQVSRYEVMISDTAEIKARWKISTATQQWGTNLNEEGVSEVRFTEFEGEEVMELTIINDGTSANTNPQGTSLYPSQYSLDYDGYTKWKFDEAKDKKYIGFRVYAFANGTELKYTFTAKQEGNITGTKRLVPGWNEVVIDIGAHSKFATYGIYQLAFGVVGNTAYMNGTTTHNGTEYKSMTLYFADFYATNYDMVDMVDFESVGDVNRATINDYAGVRYACNDGTVSASVEYNGEYALQAEATVNKAYVNVSFKSTYFFPKDMSGYKQIKFRVHAGHNKQFMDFYLYDTNYKNYKCRVYDKVEPTGWIEYTIDLADVGDVDLTSLMHIQFTMQRTDGSVDAGSFYLDYIQFVK